MENKTLMQRLLEAGYPREQMFHHESDLYIYATPLTKKVLQEWVEDNGFSFNIFVKKFKSESPDDYGKPMYDIAFQYDDYWKEKCGGEAV